MRILTANRQSADAHIGDGDALNAEGLNINYFYNVGAAVRAVLAFTPAEAKALAEIDLYIQAIAAVALCTGCGWFTCGTNNIAKQH